MTTICSWKTLGSVALSVSLAACGGTMKAPVTVNNADVPADTQTQSAALEPAADPPPPETDIGAAVALPGELEFAFRSAKIARTAANEAILGQLLAFLQKNDRVTQLRIEGHTDSVGSHARNQHLSEARALAVAKWLEAHGVDESRLHVVGFGEDQPLANNATRSGRARNRRTGFFVERTRPAEEAVAKRETLPALVAVSAAAAAPAAAREIAWDVRMNQLGTFTHLGTSGAFTCGPMPTTGTVYSDVYAGEGDIYGYGSALCAAALYAGKITKAKGGTFRVFYKGIVQHDGPPKKLPAREGLTMKELASSWAFGFEGSDESPIALDWHDVSSPADKGQRFENHFFMLVAIGEKKTFVCPPAPPGEKPDGVMFGETYHVSSWGCWAAVHAGKITAEKGGTFTAVVRSTRESNHPLQKVAKNGVAPNPFYSGIGGTFVSIE